MESTVEKFNIPTKEMWERCVANSEGKDTLKLLASEIYEIPYEDVSDELRRTAKSLIFHLCYGDRPPIVPLPKSGFGKKTAINVYAQVHVLQTDILNWWNGLSTGEKDVITKFYHENKPVWLVTPTREAAYLLFGKTIK